MLYANKITTSEKYVCVPSGSVTTPMDHSNDITRVHLTTRFYKNDFHCYCCGYKHEIMFIILIDNI